MADSVLQDAINKVNSLLRSNVSAIKLYRANFATPQELEAMRFWAQSEYRRIQDMGASTDQVIKLIAGVLQDLIDAIEAEGPPSDGSDGQDGEDGQDGATGPEGPQGPPGEDGNAGDLINDSVIKYDMTWSSRKISEELNSLAQDLADHETAYNPHGKMNWLSPYVPGDSAVTDDVVLDDGYLMIANQDTNEPAAPDPFGQPFWVYDGTILETSDSASQITFGNRYPINSTGYISGYRVYIVTGNHYNIYTVVDPLGIPIINQLSDFTATTTGWVSLALTPIFVGGSVVVDLVAVVNEPAPTPVTVVAEYIYSAPQNASPPANGEIIQGRSTPDVMRISYTDNDAIDRTALIQGLSIGDIIIAANGGQWTVQGNTDAGSYAFINVSPASVGGTGTQDFTFETVAPTPITYAHDLNYWSASSFPAVEGLLGVDTAYGDIVPNDNAYGVDILVQYASVSDHWDFLAYTDAAGGGDAGRMTPEERVWVSASAMPIEYSETMTAGAGWSEDGRLAIPVDTGYRVQVYFTAKRTNGFGYYYSQRAGLALNNAGTVSVSSTQIFEESTDVALDTRITVDGQDIVFEVKAMGGQDWRWSTVFFSKEIT